MPFLKIAPRILVFCALCLAPFLARAQAARADLRLDSDWQFHQGEVAGAEQADFNAAGWQAVTLPHCWGWEQAQKGDTKYYRGPGWYQHELAVTPEKGKRYFSGSRRRASWQTFI